MFNISKWSSGLILKSGCANNVDQCIQKFPNNLMTINNIIGYIVSDKNVFNKHGLFFSFKPCCTNGIILIV